MRQFTKQEFIAAFVYACCSLVCLLLYPRYPHVLPVFIAFSILLLIVALVLSILKDAALQKEDRDNHFQ